VSHYFEKTTVIGSPVQDLYTVSIVTLFSKSRRILKELKNNKNIAILKCDKGNSVVTIDRNANYSGLLKIINSGLPLLFFH